MASSMWGGIKEIEKRGQRAPGEVRKGWRRNKVERESGRIKKRSSKRWIKTEKGRRKSSKRGSERVDKRESGRRKKTPEKARR